MMAGTDIVRNFKDVTDGRGKDERGLWEGLVGGVVWIGIEKGKGKERCVVKASPRVMGVDGAD